MSDGPGVSLTFGSVGDMAEVATQLAQALGTTFDLRDSMYLGGEYYRSVTPWGEVIVQRNDDLGEPAEPTHPELPTLVRVDVAATAESSVVAAMQPLRFTFIDRTV